MPKHGVFCSIFINMIRILKNLLITLFACSFFSCASGHHNPFPNDLEIKRNLDAVERKLQEAVSCSEDLSMDVIGTVEYDKFCAPIWFISFRSSQNPDHRILLSAGIHGNEPAGVHCMIDFIEDLSKRPSKLPLPVYCTRGRARAEPPPLSV